MGLQLKGLIRSHIISFDDLSGKKLAFDSFNLLYQFLTTIRQQDGTPLKDDQGNITSHLAGLFARATFLMQKNIRPVFVFDGKPPALKSEEQKKRREQKELAMKKYKEAVIADDTDAMRKYSSRTSRLDKKMIAEAKELLTALGLPYLDAPSEGEAQAAYMAKKGDVYATVSQDFDTLMFGSPKIIRNLSISQRRRMSNSPAYQKVDPEIIILSEVLNELGIDNDLLIMLGIMIGTDYNPGGIKGIGPKKALKLIKENKHEELLEKADFDWKKIYSTILNMETTDDYDLVWKAPSKDKVIELMCTRHNFSSERIRTTMDKLVKSNQQKGLSDFF